MPTKKSEQQKITRSIGMGLIIGVIVWIIALCFAADYVNKSVANTAYELRIGPFWLSTLTKKAVNGGFVASISLHAGLAWFIAFFGLGNGLIELTKSLRRRPPSTDRAN